MGFRLINKLQIKRITFPTQQLKPRAKWEHKTQNEKTNKNIFPDSSAMRCTTCAPVEQLIRAKW